MALRTQLHGVGTPFRIERWPSPLHFVQNSIASAIVSDLSQIMSTLPFSGASAGVGKSTKIRKIVKNPGGLNRASARKEIGNNFEKFFDNTRILGE
jgi:hypothetical protein